MARVSYIEGTDDPELDGLVEKIRSGRRGSLINVYKLLLHSPPLAESWYDHLNQVRWGTQLSGRLREIIIIRIGYLNDAGYVLAQHIPKLAEAEGLSAADCAALADWKDGGPFGADECAALFPHQPLQLGQRQQDFDGRHEVYKEITLHPVLLDPLSLFFSLLIACSR